MAQLYVVATPIGHYDDMSFRAVHILKTVSLVAAEDTRQSALLFKHFNIQTPLTACHDHNENQKIEQLIAHLQAGQDVALISDAGTPLISDPGFKLVRAAQQHGIRVSPVPGACAAIAALSAVGLPSDRFCFEGFLPSKAQQRQAELARLKSETATLIFYEAPHRIVASLTDMCDILGADRRVGFAREITKTFETIRQTSLAELLQFVTQDHHQQKGEIVLVVAGNPKQTDYAAAQLDDLLKRLLQDLSVKHAAQLAADLTGVKKKIAYQRALDLHSMDDASQST